MSGAGCPRVPHPFAADPLRRGSPLDLHVLGTPPAFVLSQDQTLHRSASRPRGRSASCERSAGGVGTPTTFRSASCPDGLATSTRGRVDAANRASRSRETHWLLAHCSVLKVRAGPVEGGEAPGSSGREREPTGRARGTSTGLPRRDQPRPARRTNRRRPTCQTVPTRVAGSRPGASSSATGSPSTLTPP